MIRVSKCPLKDIVKNDAIYDRINEVVYRCKIKRQTHTILFMIKKDKFFNTY